MTGPSAVPAVVLCLLLTGAVTLFPYDFHRAAARLSPDGTTAASPARRVLTPDFVLNVLLFAPTGALLHLALRERLRPRAAVLATAGSGLLISTAIEGLQWFLPERDPSLRDLAANTAGALGGAVCHRWWCAVLAVRVRRWQARATAGTLAGVMALFTIVALTVSARMQRESRITGWSTEYPLLAGNEGTGDRPWRGRLYAFQLADAAVSSSAMRRFSAGYPLAWPLAPLVAFDLTGPPPYRDATGHVPALEWAHQQRTPADMGTAWRAGPVWLRTVGPASAIARRIQRANAFTAHVVCATDAVAQSGPARIVSNSIDVNHRNFTIGQQGQDMVVRVRTRHTGLNGSRPEFHVPGVFTDTGRRDILVSYDGASLRAAVAGSSQVRRVTLTPGSALAFRLTSLQITGSLWMLQVIYVAALFTAGGTLLLLLAPPGARRTVLGVGWALAFSVLLEAVLVMASGRAVDAPGVAANAAMGMAVLAALGVVPVTRRSSGRCTCVEAR